MEEQAKGGRRVRRAGMGTGTTSLLMIFTLLCLATLAMLSISTAKSDQRIKQRSLHTAQDLAAAEGNAAEAMAQLDETLAAIAAKYGVGQQQQYYTEALQTLAANGFAVNASDNTVEFTVAVNDNNQLQTIVQILPPGGGAHYSVKSQIQVSIVDWQADEGGGVWQGSL